MTKARWNLLVDAAIGVAFIVEAVSGFVLWLVLPHGGFQGGRNLAYAQAFIVSRDTWLLLHDWFAVVMVLGVLIHLALHWRWVVCMVRKLWQDAATRPVQAQPQPQREPADCSVS